MKRRFVNRGVLPPVLTLGVAAAALVWFYISLSGASRGGTEAGRMAAENAVKRAVLTCYALEGAYPENYDYLEENYGISVNTDRYIIHYEIFASNIMPDISVLVRGGDT
jgi:hypothetical protein